MVIFGYYLGFDNIRLGFGYPISLNSITARYFATSDQIQIPVWVSDKMSNPIKSYEYKMSIIYISIIYIYILISFDINYVLYTNI